MTKQTIFSSPDDTKRRGDLRVWCDSLVDLFDDAFVSYIERPDMATWLGAAAEQLKLTRAQVVIILRVGFIASVVDIATQADVAATKPPVDAMLFTGWRLLSQPGWQRYAWDALSPAEMTATVIELALTARVDARD